MTLKIGVGLFNSKTMFITKTKIKIIAGVIFIFLCFLNIAVMTDRDINSKLSISLISRDALAEGEGPYPNQGFNCGYCEYPNHLLVYFNCQPSPYKDCSVIPCGEGYCY
jgi:hypothetical protein